MNEGKQPRPKYDRAEGDQPDLSVAEPEEAAAPSLDDNEDLQKTVLSKIRETNGKWQANRLAELRKALEQRLYYKGIQNFQWDDKRRDVIFEDEDDGAYDRVFNITQGYGKIFQATFMGATPKVRAEADDPFDGTQIKNTAKAGVYQRLYAKWNNVATQQMRISRLYWTDGRVITRTTQTETREITEFWGVLEARLPIAAKEDDDFPLKNCPIVELEDEYPLVRMKADYPHARKKLNSGNGESYERNCRTAAKREASSDNGVDVNTGEDSYGLGTKTWTYLRPEFYEHFDEADRTQLEEIAPAGLCIVHSGDVYLESYECDMDAVLDVMHPLPGDGMNHGSIGQPVMDIQDSVNTAQNLIEETFDHGIPTTYYDSATNIDELNKQVERPGQSRKMVLTGGKAAEDHFFETTPLNPSAQLMEYLENLRGPMAQFAAATQPAAFGAEMQDQKTASGYAQARTQALGMMVVPWKPYTAWYARENTRAIVLASTRESDIADTIPAQRRGGRSQAVRILPSELAGVKFTNASDENFPQTWSEKRNVMMQLLQMGGEVADWVLQSEPDNLYTFKEMTGLEELVVPGEDLRNLVLEDIAALEVNPMMPDPSQPLPQMIPMPGQPPPQPPMIPRIMPDTEFLEDEDFATGWKTVKHWVISPAGQEAKATNPQWFEAVRQYGMAYKQGMVQAQQAKQAAQQEPPDLPKVAIPYDSLPTQGKVQAAQHAGIQLNPADVAATPNPKAQTASGVM